MGERTDEIIRSYGRLPRSSDGEEVSGVSSPAAKCVTAILIQSKQKIESVLMVTAILTWESRGLYFIEKMKEMEREGKEKKVEEKRNKSELIRNQEQF